MAKAQAASQPATSFLRQALPYVGLGVGLWAAVAPYALLGPDLNAAAKNEFVDHVVPGALVIVLSVAMLLRSKRPANGGSFPLLAGFGVLLGGLWMSATHLPLVKDAQNDIVATDVTAWHTIPGIVVMILGGAWAATFWAEAGEPAAKQ